MHPKKPRASIYVGVSDHARERARERFPGFKSARIKDEVHDALVNGRISAHRPAWCSMTVREDSLYVWTADCTRVYVLVTDTFSGGGSFIVATTLVGKVAA